MRPADATRVGVAPETASARAAVAGLSTATAAAVAEAAGRGALVLYDFELSYSRKQAEQAVKRASSSAGGGGSARGHHGASSGGAPNPFAGGAHSSGGGVFGRLFGCFRKPSADAAAVDATPADPAAAAAANATAAAAVAATGVQPGTPRTPQSLQRIKEALAHAGVPNHKKVRLAFEDEVLAKTWHSLVALTLGYVAPADDHPRSQGRAAGGGTQSRLGAYQS
jgi:hypothetical protein